MGDVNLTAGDLVDGSAGRLVVMRHKAEEPTIEAAAEEPIIDVTIYEAI